MRPPFDAPEFFGVFARYNEAVWPAQLVLAGLAVGAVALALHARPWGDRAVSAILALLWVWMGLVYHLGFFHAINPVAAVFAAAFLFQAAAFGVVGVWQNRLTYHFGATPRALIGGMLLGLALVVYPQLAAASGHHYPATPTFGLPCPTTIFTLGMLLLPPRVPKALVVVPLAWSAVGALAAVQLGVWEDLSLAAAGATALLVWLAPPARRLRGAAS
jgi:hypothetical protein